MTPILEDERPGRARWRFHEARVGEPRGPLSGDVVRVYGRPKSRPWIAVIDQYPDVFARGGNREDAILRVCYAATGRPHG